MADSTKTHKPFSARSAYVYVVSAISLCMIVIGMWQLTQYTVRRMTSADYRLDGYEETRCDYVQIPVMDDKTTAIDIQRQKVESDKCVRQLADERSYRKIADLVNAGFLVLAGATLFTTHFVVLRRKWD